MDMGNINNITEQILIGSAADLVNKGHITEMVAWLELIRYKNSGLRPEIYFWMRAAKNSMAEVDYLLTHDMNIMPIEIKAGTRGGMKSLYYFMEEKHLSFAIRSSLENFGEFTNDDCTIDIIPLYALSNLYK